MPLGNRAKQITAEACIHFLHFDDSQYATLGNLVKRNPAVEIQSQKTLSQT